MFVASTASAAIGACTFSVVLGAGGMMGLMGAAIVGLESNRMRLVHGLQQV